MNKKERLKHYENALHMLKTGNTGHEYYNGDWAKNHSGMCELLSLSVTGGASLSTHFDEEDFKEFFLFEPERKDEYLVYWFAESNRKLRKIILEFCIEMVKAKI